MPYLALGTSLEISDILKKSYNRVNCDDQVRPAQTLRFRLPPLFHDRVGRKED